MGLIRKVLSLGTLGAVDFRSDKERTAAYTRGARNQANLQTAQLRRQTKALEAQTAAAERLAQAQSRVPVSPPAAWHPDPEDRTQLRWWDGQRWTEHRQPL